MNISTYITLLREIQEEHGDLEMTHTSLDGHVRPAPLPKVNHMLILTEKQHKQKYWTSHHPAERRGKLVVEA